jgi:3-deoxy-D-manno-octulosonate 8-phosphate phosphatase (KDO 8-P phosphatase)
MEEANILAKFRLIKTFIFDMDGVLTDGTLLHLSSKKFLRKTNMKDGFVLKLASTKGYSIVILSGSSSKPVKKRMEYLGVTDVFMGIDNKKEHLQKYIESNNLNTDEILYMGDDVKDYTAMQLVGLPCCPADGVADIRQISKYISPYKGGEGCVRDVMEKVLKLQGNWELD